MRRPHQVLVFPYKQDKDKNYLYGVFKRSDNGQIQAISGGVEDFDKTYVDACKRELEEETGLNGDLNIMELESISTIPVVNVTGEFTWGKNTYFVYEHCFGVEVGERTISLSHEHTKMEWLTYEEAQQKLTWDSNKNALWELNYKLTHNE